MKAAIVLVALVLAVGWAHPSPRRDRTLGDDFNYIKEIIPFQQMGQIMNKYLQNDIEIQGMYVWYQSRSYHQHVRDVDAMPEFRYFINYLEKNGVPIYKILNKWHELIGMDPISPNSIYKSDEETGGLRAFVDEIEAVLPMDEIASRIEQLAYYSNAFKDFVNMMRSRTMVTLAHNLEVDPVVQMQFIEIKRMGIDVNVFINFVNENFGWGLQEVFNARASSTLNDDLNDFVSLISMDDVSSVALEYLAEDEEVQKAMEYLQSPEFGNLLVTIEGIKEYKDFLNYLQNQGVDAYGFINTIHDFLGFPPIKNSVRHLKSHPTGLRGMLEEMMQAIPVADMQALFEQKLKTSQNFINLINTLKSDDFKSLVGKLAANSSFQKLIAQAKSYNLDVDQAIQVLNDFFGWNLKSHVARSTYDLNTDLNDFIKLIPIDDILAIVMDYLAEDPEVQEVMEYVQSEEFSKLITTVESIKDYIDFLMYLQNQGLDAYGAVNQLHDFLGLPPLVPPPYKRIAKRSTGGIRGMLDEIEKLIPVDQIQALYEQKMKSSPEFANLIIKMRSDEIKGIVVKLRGNPTYQHIVADAKAHGVDINKIIDVLNKIFQWNLAPSVMRSTFSLNDDLNDFMKLIPSDDILAIVMDYLSSDQEVQEAMEYIQSEDFLKLITTVESFKEYTDFLNYLQNQGLDAYGAINQLHDFLGLPPFTPRTYKRSLGNPFGGIRAMLTAIEQLIPVDQLQALYEQKLKSSPQFAELIEKIKSDEFKGMVEKLRANPTYQHIVADARTHGVDINKIIEVLNKIFGWNLKPNVMRSTYSLNDDFNDFAKLIPSDDVMEIVMNYLANDDEVQQIFEYFQSEEFSDLITAIDGIKEYIDFLNYLQNQGVDAYGAVNQLHDFLGLKPLVPPTYRLKNSHLGGLRGMLDSIEEIIPFDKLHSLFQQKLQTSSQFADLVNHIKSDEFKGLVMKVKANPTFQKLETDAKSHGVDVAKLIDILNNIFGWGL